jgi:hypothetical protein
LLLAQPYSTLEKLYVFPAKAGEGHFVGIVRVLKQFIKMRVDRL